MGADANDLANLALALEHELRKALERAALLERTVDSLKDQLLKSAERELALQREIAELKGKT